MKLVTFLTPDGEQRVGDLRDDRVAELDTPDMRSLFAAGLDARATGAEHARESITLKAPIDPRKFFHTAGNFREHADEGEKVRLGASRSGPGSSSSRTSTRSSGRTSRSSIPSHLTEELDYELELAVVLKKSGKHFSAEEAEGLHRRLRHLQRRDRARHPAAGDEVGRLQLLEGDRHLLPAGAAHRDRRRDPRPARPGHGAAGERRAAPALALQQDDRDDPGDPGALLGAWATARATWSRPGRSRAWPPFATTRRPGTSSPAT